MNSTQSLTEGRRGCIWSGNTFLFSLWLFFGFIVTGGCSFAFSECCKLCFDRPCKIQLLTWAYISALTRTAINTQFELQTHKFVVYQLWIGIWNWYPTNLNLALHFWQAKKQLSWIKCKLPSGDISSFLFLPINVTISLNILICLFNPFNIYAFFKGL